ncbi:MAG: endonuclease/exonuclease/phosphatase family protein [Actinomycetota bacterium]
MRDERSPGETVIRVVSWNIRFGIEVDTAIGELLGVDDLVDADLLLLQEMDETGVARIAEALGAEHVFSSVAIHRQSGRDFGNAIVSRWPLSDPASVPLPHVAPVSGHPRAAARARVHVGDRELLVYSTHTETPALRLRRRVEQFRRIAADVEHEGADRVVVGGDFNTVTARGVEALTRTMASAGLRRASAVADPTFRRAGREVPLDHVFVAGLTASAAGAVPTTAASDHRPIWARLV